MEIRVLIVEDQPADAELMLRELRQTGFEPDWQRVQTEADYAAALRGDPDIILSDYSLPQFDALRALHLLLDWALDVPFIVVTGSVGEEAAVDCLKQGAADYVLKDRLARLGPAVQRALNEKLLRDENRQAEAARRESEERYRLLAENSLDLIELLDLQATLLYASPSHRQVLAYAPDELVGRALFEVIHPGDSPVARAVLGALLATGASRTVEVQLRNALGGWVDVEAVLSLVNDGAGAARRILFSARDITERKRAERGLRRQTFHAEALARVAARLNAQLDLEAVLNAVSEETAHALNVPMVGLSLYDEKSDALRLAGGFGIPPDYVAQAQPVPRLTYEAFARQPGGFVIIPDVQALADAPQPDSLARAALNLRTLVSARLLRDGQLVGALSLATHWEVRDFNADELAVVRTLADQAALAITNAQQHAHMQRRLQESEAMASISRALNETLDTERIFQMIVDVARRIIPQVERAVIHLLDEKKQALRPAAVAGLDELGRPAFTMRPGEGVAGQVIAEGIAINVSDTFTDPRYLPLGRATHLRSLLVAPVQSGQRRLGTISVQSAAPNAFSSDDAWLLATLGVQAALAIENARLFEFERRRVKEAEALQQVTQKLIIRLSLPEMLQAVVEAVTTIANYQYVSIYLLQDERLALQAQKGYDAPPPVLQLDQGVGGRVARTGQPAFVPDVQLDPDYLEVVPAVRSLIAVPLTHANQMLGVLMVESDAERVLDESDLNWLSNVSRQISVAIENTRLVTDLERALQQEKAARAQLVQTEKLAAMGRMVASVAHELNNPLQAIQNALYLVKQESNLGAQAREDLQVALTEADRMAELISRLRATYRPASSEDFRPESLNTLVEDVRKLITTHLRHNNVTLEFEGDPKLPLVRGLRDQFKQALLNLSLNAVEAMPHGGQLTIRTRYAPESGGVWLLISDTGIGIKPEALPNVFDPFFTTKESGTGLGLAITHDIIQRHGGRIEVASEPDRGTTFRVWLPVDKRPIPRHNSRL